MAEGVTTPRVLVSYETLVAMERQRDEARELVWRAFNPHSPPSWQAWMADVEELDWVKQRLAEDGIDG